ncbi:MAG TPA: sugar ABC transporter permease [Spirochaetia bacterium]|nr:sugar ABC transporter permease [Spirochaetia bacterium]
MKSNTHGWSFVLPAMIVVAVMTQVPFVMTLIYSTLRWNLARPDLPIKFVGLQNYIRILSVPNFPQVPEFYSTLWQTIILTASSLVLCTVFGFLLSVLLDNKIPGVNVARTLILGPFFVMSTVTGVIWKTTIFNTTFGWYGVLAKTFGITSVDLLSYYPLPVIIFLFSWQWMPFFVLVILAGLQGIPLDLTDSMRIDGTNWLQSTFQVKLPLIANHLRIAVMLGLIFIVKEFALILVTTAGGPGTRSYTLPYEVYMTVFNASDVGRAGALAVMTVAVTLLAVNILYRSINKRRTAY